MLELQKEFAPWFKLQLSLHHEVPAAYKCPAHGRVTMWLTTEYKMETPSYRERRTESWALPNEAQYLLTVLSDGMHFDFV